MKKINNHDRRTIQEIPNINPNIVYTVAAFHDISHHIDSKKHEIISAENCVYIDDKLSLLEIPKKLGILFTNPEETRKELIKLGVKL